MNFNTIPPERVRYLVVHCSATTPKQDIGVAEIDRMHRQRGFFKCGYHYVIRRDGTIESGRKVDVTTRVAEPGAHFAGLNLISLGICLVGGVTQKPTHEGVHEPEANFTPEQYAALRSLLVVLLADYQNAQVIGHGDPLRPGESNRPVSAKACPSFDVRKWIDDGFPDDPPTRS